jgi:hypothetical protein
LAEYAKNLGGTLNWRNVAGTQRLSNHSFAGAIDLNLDKSTYWRWQPAAKLPTFSRLSFPQPIIETFERHGFIWGGKWYHYDTMHFEYRTRVDHVCQSAGEKRGITGPANPIRALAQSSLYSGRPCPRPRPVHAAGTNRALTSRGSAGSRGRRFFGFLAIVSIVLVYGFWGVDVRHLPRKREFPSVRRSTI